MTNLQAPSIPTQPPVTFALWLGYGALCVGMFMAILDIQVVVTSLVVIEEALGIGAERMSWVQTTYLIAEIISIPLTGLLIRIFTIRWLFVGAICTFTLASIGCALSFDFVSLISFRVIQGFAGGVLIPLVFSAIFLLFGKGFNQTVATTVGGLLAVLAPTLGPLIGGWITDNYSWHWLFLINVVPGIATLIVGVVGLPKGITKLELFKTLDWLSLVFIAVGLAALLIGLKEAPEYGWWSPRVMALFATVAVAGLVTLRRPSPAISFKLLHDRNLAYGCILIFILGVGLFGSVYLMPLFLAFVQGMKPLDIGLIILVTGVAQLIAAPFIVQIDRFMDARFLSAIGFLARLRSCRSLKEIAGEGLRNVRRAATATVANKAMTRGDHQPYSGASFNPIRSAVSPTAMNTSDSQSSVLNNSNRAVPLGNPTIPTIRVAMPGTTLIRNSQCQL